MTVKSSIKSQKNNKDLSGAWSATPTPLTESMKIDTPSVKRLVKHHIRLRQKGVFVGGTCGEGPFLKRQDFRRMTSSIAQANNGCMIIAVQVTDNSYARVLDNIEAAKADGADIAIVAEPWFTGPISENDILKYYLETAEKSKLPIGIYSRGGSEVPVKFYKKILSHPNVCMFKDSSCSDEIMRIAISVAKKRKSLSLMTGYELGMPPYLEAGYDSVLAGGGILIGALTAKMIQAASQSDFKEVARLQKHCDRINYAAYGGRKITSWLTGLKYTLVKMGIFKTTAGYLQYPLSALVKKTIRQMVDRDKDILFPPAKN
jgi:dihydrodipicolinate synthase/N-acetylneuraminate lyase